MRKTVRKWLMICYIADFLKICMALSSPIVKVQLFSTATVFLEFWKRRRAVLTYDWDLIDWEDEEVRRNRSLHVNHAISMVKVSVSIHIVCQSSEFVIQIIFVFIALVAEYKGMLEIVQGYFAFCN